MESGPGILYGIWRIGFSGIDLERMGLVRKIPAIAHAHDRQRFPGRDDMAMAGACVIGMTMADHGPVHRPNRINIEVTGPDIQTLRPDLDPMMRAVCGARAGTANSA